MWRLALLAGTCCIDTLVATGCLSASARNTGRQQPPVAPLTFSLGATGRLSASVESTGRQAARGTRHFCHGCLLVMVLVLVGQAATGKQCVSGCTAGSAAWAGFRQAGPVVAQPPAAAWPPPGQDMRPTYSAGQQDWLAPPDHAAVGLGCRPARSSSKSRPTRPGISGKTPFSGTSGAAGRTSSTSMARCRPWVTCTMRESSDSGSNCSAERWPTTARRSTPTGRKSTTSLITNPSERATSAAAENTNCCSSRRPGRGCEASSGSAPGFGFVTLRTPSPRRATTWPDIRKRGGRSIRTSAWRPKIRRTRAGNFSASTRIGFTPVTYQYATYFDSVAYPKCGLTGRIEAGVRFQKFSLSACAEAMTWAQSDAVTDPYGDISFQPASRMITIGGQLSYTF